MKTRRLQQKPTCVFNIAYHLIWCPKYRYKILVDGVDVVLKEALLKKAVSMCVEIHTLEVMPDHVHLFVKAPPTLSPSKIVQGFKGFSSRVLRDAFPHLKRRLPCTWTRSFYCESIGHISQDTVVRYIEQQKGRAREKL